MATNKTIDLVGAAARLKRDYHTVWRLVLRGELHGERQPNGRWLVSVADVERLARRTDSGPKTATAGVA